MLKNNENSKICPRCQSNEITKSGKHYNLDKVVQRYICKICGTSFVKSDGYFKGKHPLSLLQYAGALYNDGLSCEKVADKIKEEFNIIVSKVTIMHWIHKLKVTTRSKSSGDQKHKIVRELIEVGVVTTVRFVESKTPEKFVVLDNVVEKMI